MRYCLACRRLSADGPLCTSCGRSFGGRLCNHKKGRHLNPHGANVCGQCGSTTLTDAANHIPFAWAGRLLLWGGLLGCAWLIGSPLLHWALGASGIARYHDPRIWLIETVARLLMPFATLFFVFYTLSFLIPGEPGNMMRSAMTGTVRWAVQIILRLSQNIGTALGRLLLGWMGGGTRH